MRVYLAGIEGCGLTYLEPAGIQVRNAFTTFYRVHKSSAAKAITMMQRVRNLTLGNVVCDSGAHTFFAENPLAGCSASGHSKSTQTVLDPDTYFKRYVDFMHACPFIDYFVELDIGELVGQPKIESWRETLKREGLWERIITAFHPTVISWEDFEHMCADSGSHYVAVEGDRPLQRKGRLDYTRVIQLARKYACRVHGFAMTKPDALVKYPFYSVDSTSWNAVSVYGKSAIIKKHPIIARHDRKWIKTFEGRRYLYMQEIKAWEAFEDYYTSLWAARGVLWK